MKVYIQLVCFIIVTCQANLLPQNRQLYARQGKQIVQHYEKLRGKDKQYQIDNPVHPDRRILLVPDIYKPEHLRVIYKPNRKPLMPYVSSRMTDPALFNTSLMNQSVEHRELAEAEQEAQLQLAQADRAAYFAEIDRDALSKLSDEDRDFLVSHLSQADRQNLVAKLDDSQLDEVFPLEENRFSFTGISGLTGVAAKIGAGAGRYIGQQLAGSLGAKLGAAAGAYLGAAAASRFESKSKNKDKVLENSIQSMPSRGIQYGASYGHTYGAVLLDNK